jgi:hypothetical protein
LMRRGEERGERGEEKKGGSTGRRDTGYLHAPKTKKPVQ